MSTLFTLLPQETPVLMVSSSAEQYLPRMNNDAIVDDAVEQRMYGNDCRVEVEDPQFFSICIDTLNACQSRWN